MSENKKIEYKKEVSVTENTVQLQREQNKITIGDVAEALGVSKTTVSRAISGKGRIGEVTRKRVLEYIKENHYRPNIVAKGLAKSKTYNIGWVMPGDSNITELPFFQRCMIGISEVAAAYDYDILLSMVFAHDISKLKSIVKNCKADGIILGRTLIEDESISFLKETDIPFVVIVSSDDEKVIQIDNDHIEACRELTSVIIMKGIKKLALIGGSMEHVVNRTRRKGFEMALMEHGLGKDAGMVYMDCETDSMVEHATDVCLRGEAECIICADDRICAAVLNKLNRDGVSIPDRIKVASFYDSIMLDNYKPAISSLCYDPKELGMVACTTLLDYINGKQVQKKILLGYDVVLKGSTK